MKQILTILFFAFSASAFAQKADTADLVRCVADLNKALVKKDTIRLKFLLANDLHYYHSNGWEQTKREVIADLYNGKLTYKTITPSAKEVHIISNDLAEVQGRINAEVELDGKPLHLDLDVIQSWGWKNERWQLVSRVSKKTGTQD